MTLFVSRDPLSRNLAGYQTAGVFRLNSNLSVKKWRNVLTSDCCQRDAFDFCPVSSNQLPKLYRSVQNHATHKNRNSRFWGLLRSSFFVLLTLAAVLVLVIWMGQDRIGAELTRAAEQVLNARLEDCGWTVGVRDAHWSSTHGVTVGQVEFFARGQTHAAVRLGPVELQKENLRELVDLNFSPDQVVFSNTELRIDQAWCAANELQALVRALRPKQPPPRLPGISGHRCRLVLENSADRSTAAQVFYDIDFTTALKRDEHNRRMFVAEGTGNSARFSNSQFVVAVWPDNQAISGKIRTRGLTVRENDLAWLPLDIRRAIPQLSMLQIQGDLEIGFIHSPTSGHPLQWSAGGRVHEFAMLGPGLPLPVTGGQFDFSVSPEQLRISAAQAQVGSAQLQVELVAGLQRIPGQSGMQQHPWRASGRIEDLDVGTLEPARLPTEIAKLFQQFAPAGIADFRFELGWDGRTFTRDLAANIQDMSFRFHRFPWLLENCVGNASWVADRCQFSVQSLENGQIIELGGWIDSPGPDARFQIDFGCQGELAIDEKLYRAVDLYPEIAKQIRDLRPRGAFGVSGRFVKSAAQSDPLLEFTLDLKQCLVRHTRFDYPVREVTGQVIARGRDVDFVDIRGRNATTQIQGSGRWRPESGLQLTAIADDLVLDSQVRAALPPAAAAAWDQIRPAGIVNLVRIDLTVPAGTDPATPGDAMKVTIRADASAPTAPGESGLSIKPAQFPWQLDRVSAHMELDENQFRVTELRGVHGRAWVNTAASGTWNDDSWRLVLSGLTAGSVAVNDELLGALPADLAKALEDIDFSGVVQISGEMAFASRPVAAVAAASPVALVSYPVTQVSAATVFPARTFQSDWNLRVDTHDASLSPGLPIRNVSGMLTLAGRQIDGQSLCTGQLDIEAASVYDAWITRLRGPVSFDNHLVAVGMFAASANDSSGTGPQSLQGEMFGGELHLDARCWDAEGGRFYCQATLKEGKLSRAAGCLSDSVCETGGIASCALRCGGDLHSRESITGDGVLRLTDARLYEMPVMMDVLGAMLTGNARRSAFDTGTVDFGLRGDQIDLNRIELNGDALSLIGNGTMDWSHRVDLNFYTVMGRNRLYIPILSELYQAGSQQILWVVVDGTLETPVIRQQILPGINEGLRLLLEPVERTAASQ